MIKIVLILILLFAAMKVIFKIRGEKIQFYMSEGDKLFNEGDYDKALIFYKSALKISPVVFAAYFKINSIQNHLGRYAEALSICDDLIKQFPKSAESHNRKGVSFIYSGKPIQALECFDTAIKMEPKTSYAYFNKGVTLSILGEYQESITQLDIAIEHGFEYATACNYKGIALMLQCKFKEAEELYMETINEYTEDEDLYYSLSSAQFYLGNYKEAKANLLKIEDNNSNPKHINFEDKCLVIDYTRSVEILYSQGAITDDYLKQLKDNDCAYNKDICNTLAECITTTLMVLLADDIDTANWAIDIWTSIFIRIIKNEYYGEQISQKVINLNKIENKLVDDNKPYLYIEENSTFVTSVLKGVMFKLLRNQLYNIYLLVIIVIGIVVISKAPIGKWHYTTTEDIRKSAEESLNTVPALNNQGKLLIKYGSYDKAIELLDKAITSDPSIAELYYNRGNALLGLKKYDEAFFEFNKAIELNPNFTEAIEIKLKLDELTKDLEK